MTRIKPSPGASPEFSTFNYEQYERLMVNWSFSFSFLANVGSQYTLLSGRPLHTHTHTQNIQRAFLFCLFCLFGFLTSSSTTRLYRGRAPRQERLTILRAATHETELGDHDFCLSRSHYTDTDPTCRERAATAGIEPGTSSPGVARYRAPLYREQPVFLFLTNFIKKISALDKHELKSQCVHCRFRAVCLVFKWVSFKASLLYAEPPKIYTILG